MIMYAEANMHRKCRACEKHEKGRSFKENDKVAWILVMAIQMKYINHLRAKRCDSLVPPGTGCG